MKRLFFLASLAALFVLCTVPALAQEAEVQPDPAFDQYNNVDGLGGPGGAAAADAAADAVEDIVSDGKEADGAAAYEAALNAAREAGADTETAEVVAAEAVSEVSEEPTVAEKYEIAELPDTGGAPTLILGAGLLVAGAGVLTRRLF